MPRSILAPSLELEKMRKMELFNIIVPLLGQPKELYSKAVNQIIKVNEEDPEDWLPDSWDENAPEPLFTPGPNGMIGGGVPGQVASSPAPNAGGPTVVPSNPAPSLNSNLNSPANRRML